MFLGVGKPESQNSSNYRGIKSPCPRNEWNDAKYAGFAKRRKPSCFVIGYKGDIVERRRDFPPVCSSQGVEQAFC
jgi:hypothetical protein